MRILLATGVVGLALVAMVAGSAALQGQANRPSPADISAVGPATEPGARPFSITPPFVAETELSYAKAYTDMRDLVADADLVVDVSVRAVARTDVRGSVEEGTFRGVDTVFAVTVLAVGVGPDVSVGQMLMVSQPGGQLDGLRASITGWPSLDVGEEYVLFLSAVPDAELYQIQGGPMGTLIVTGGKATSISKAGGDPELPDLGFMDRAVARVLENAADMNSD